MNNGDSGATIGRDGDAMPEQVSQYPEGDVGDCAQPGDVEEAMNAWRDLGEATAEHAIREWQAHLAAMPWWKRWAVKLWYSI